MEQDTVCLPNDFTENNRNKYNIQIFSDEVQSNYYMLLFYFIVWVRWPTKEYRFMMVVFRLNFLSIGYILPEISIVNIHKKETNRETIQKYI